MILFPKSEHTYTNQIGIARRVIIDGQFFGDLVEVQPPYAGNPFWIVVLWGGICGGNVFGNAEFTTREFALNYIKACAHAHNSVELAQWMRSGERPHNTTDEINDWAKG